MTSYGVLKTKKNIYIYSIKERKNNTKQSKTEKNKDANLQTCKSAHRHIGRNIQYILVPKQLIINYE